MAHANAICPQVIARVAGRCAAEPSAGPRRVAGAGRPKTPAARAVVLATSLSLTPRLPGEGWSAAALATIDPITGERLRTSRRGENRYEHRSPDRLIQVDVKKRGRIPALVRRPRHPSVILFRAVRQ